MLGSEEGSQTTRADVGGLDRNAFFGVLQICDARPVPSNAGLVATRRLLSKDGLLNLNLCMNRAPLIQTPLRTTAMNPTRTQSQIYEVIHPLTLKPQTTNTKLLKTARALSLCTFSDSRTAARRLLAKFAQAQKPSGRVGKLFLMDSETGRFGCCYFWDSEGSMRTHLSSGQSTARDELQAVQEYCLVLERSELMADEESIASTTSCSTAGSSSPPPSAQASLLTSMNVHSKICSSTAVECAVHSDRAFDDIKQEGS